VPEVGWGDIHQSHPSPFLDNLPFCRRTGHNLVLCDGDNDLSFVLSGAISTKRFAHLGEPVRSIDYRDKFARLEEFAQIGQALIWLQPHIWQ
jgi:hypothetical protein